MRTSSQHRHTYSPSRVKVDVLLAFNGIRRHDRFECLVAFLKDIASVIAASSINLEIYQSENLIWAKP